MPASSSRRISQLVRADGGPPDTDEGLAAAFEEEVEEQSEQDGLQMGSKQSSGEPVLAADSNNLPFVFLCISG